MRFQITVEDTPKGIHVQLKQGHNGVLDSPDSLATLHVARFLMELKQLREMGLVHSNPINI